MSRCHPLRSRDDEYDDEDGLNSRGLCAKMALTGETMDDQNWKDDLKACFDDLRVIATCRAEALERFVEFCDYVVEPAFEALEGEFLRFQVKSKYRTVPGASTHLGVRFPRSRVDQFHYILWMPKNSVELKLKITIQGRRSPAGPLEEKTMPFIVKSTAKEILKIEIDALAQDVIARYRKFLFEGVLGSD